MAWWRRRHKPAHAATPVRRQPTWAAPAFPPEVQEAVAAAVAAAPVVPSQRTDNAVRLGFDDGSEMHLPAEDPRARALQAVADLLVKTEPAAPTTNNETPHRETRRIV